MSVSLSTTTGVSVIDEDHQMLATCGHETGDTGEIGDTGERKDTGETLDI